MFSDTLQGVIATDLLQRRASRPPDYQAENEALRELMDTLAYAPERVLQRLVEIVMTLCDAQSGGLSIEEDGPDGGRVFRWWATAGVAASFQNATMPCEASPCGLVVESAKTQLLVRPDQAYPALAAVDPPVESTLIAPFYEGGKPVGTLWVIDHGGGARPFDAEDARLMESLAGFATIAWRATADRRAVQEGDALLGLVTNRLPIRIAYVDREFRFRFMNDAYEREVGIQRENSIGRTVAEVMGEPMFDRVRPYYDRAFAGETHTQEFEAPYPMGNRWIRVTYVPDLNVSGAARGVVLQVLDTTEQRRSEAVLREREADLRAILNASAGGFYAVDAEGRTTSGNAAFLSMLGIDRLEDVLGEKLHATIHHSHPDGSAYLVEDCPIYRAASGGTPAHVVDESFFRVDDGTPFAVEYWTQPIVVDGENRGAVTTFLDITDRKQAAADFLASEEHYRTLFQSIDDAFCTYAMIFDDAGRCVDYRFLEVNDAFSQQTGISREDALGGKTIRQMVPTHEQYWFDLYGKVALTGESVRVENRAEGLGRWYEIHAFRIGGEGSLEVGAIFKDVSERHEQQRALTEERERLDHTLDTAGVATYDWDVRNDRMRGNALFAEFFGVPNRVEGNPLGLYFGSIHPDDRERTGFDVEDALASSERYEMRYRVRDAGGRERWLYARGESSFNADGTPDRLFGVLLDETDRALAEASKKVAWDQLDRTLSTAGVATFDWDVPRNRLTGNALLRLFYGLSDEGAESPIEAFYAAMHPDDRRARSETLNGALGVDQRYEAQYRVTGRDGLERWVLARGEVERSEDGTPRRVSGVVLDVTERVQAEEAMRQRDELFRTVFEQAPDDAILVMDLDRTLTGWNPAAERIAGWGIDEALGRSADIIFTPEDAALGVPAKETEDAARLGKAADERWHLRKDGTRFWGSGTMNSLHDAEGNVRGFLKVFRDATERYEETQGLAFLARLTEVIMGQRGEDDVILACERMLGEYLGVSRVSFSEVSEDGTQVAVEHEWSPGLPSLVGTHTVADFGPRVIDDFRSGRPHVSRDALREYAPGAGLEAVLAIGARSGLSVPLLRDGRFAALLVVHHREPRDWSDSEVALVRQAADRMLTEAERARAEEALREANQTLETRVEERTVELQSAVAEAEGFNYSISHDLRTPLRAMVATSSILLEEIGAELGDDHRALLERQAHNANRMGVLIDELLRLSRFARVAVRRECLDMTEKSRSVFDELAAHERCHGCRMEVQEGMTADGDEGLVRTILHNLLGNACKFSPDGGTIRVRQEGGVFSIADEGVGFDMRYAEKIFLPFERLVTEREFEGTGIGLANVKRLVERHGGTVWVESEPGKGTTFFFTLG